MYLAPDTTRCYNLSSQFHYLLLIFLILISLVLVGCGPTDKEKANKLYIKASDTLEDFPTDAESYNEARRLIGHARSQLRRIVNKFPQTDLAVSLKSGNTSLNGLTLKELETLREELDRLVRSEKEPDYTARIIARNLKDSDSRAQNTWHLILSSLWWDNKRLAHLLYDDLTNDGPLEPLHAESLALAAARAGAHDLARAAIAEAAPTRGDRIAEANILSGRLDIAESNFYLGHIGEAQKHLEKATDSHAATLDKEPYSRFRVALLKAAITAKTGKTEQARERFSDTRTFVSRHQFEDYETDPWTKIATVKAVLGWAVEARAAARKARPASDTFDSLLRVSELVENNRQKAGAREDATTIACRTRATKLALDQFIRLTVSQGGGNLGAFCGPLSANVRKTLARLKWPSESRTGQAFYWARKGWAHGALGSQNKADRFFERAVLTAAQIKELQSRSRALLDIGNMMDDVGSDANTSAQQVLTVLVQEREPVDHWWDSVRD